MFTVQCTIEGQTHHFAAIKSTYYRPLKIRIDGGHARVRELGSIFLVLFTITLSNVVRLLQNFVHIVSQTTWTNAANLVTLRFILLCVCI